jgi:hypothetical protein
VVVTRWFEQIVRNEWDMLSILWPIFMVLREPAMLFNVIKDPAPCLEADLNLWLAFTKSYYMYSPSSKIVIDLFWSVNSCILVLRRSATDRHCAQLNKA